ncbi:hypothetical protein Pelo_6451 [Pelomyxa schiedti]|nr:hypothetical protein Pelo_6451 [Pelomyxa schiedti]
MEYILYVRNGCPYCDKVCEFIDCMPQCTRVVVKDVCRDPAAERDLLELTHGSKQKEYYQVTGCLKLDCILQVPCLKLGDNFLHESLDIIEFLKKQFCCGGDGPVVGVS